MSTCVMRGGVDVNLFDERWFLCQPVRWEVVLVSTCVMRGGPYVNLCDGRWSLCHPA